MMALSSSRMPTMTCRASQPLENSPTGLPGAGAVPYRLFTTPTMNSRISVEMTPRLAIRSRRVADICFLPPRIPFRAIMVGDVRSVLASPPETGQGTKRNGNRLLIIGLVAFAIGFGGWLAYLAMHMEDWSLNMIDLSVYRAGGLIVRQVTEQVAKNGTVSK